jgi:lysophospholipase L1-like esterase
MTAPEQRLGRHGPPRKTVWFALFFALFGTAAWLVEARWLGGAAGGGEAGAAIAAGPIPDAAPRKIDLEQEREAARMAKGERIAAPHQALEDPHGAMAQFYGALRELESGGGPGVVRAVHYGDSILTSDHLPNRIRSILQTRFGDAGHGFILLGRPWSWYKHQGVPHGVSGKWRARTITADPLTDGMYGLGGVAFEAGRGSHGRVRIGTAEEGELNRRIARVDLGYLEQPRGGSFEILVNGALRERVETRGATVRAAHEIVEVPPGQAKVEVEYDNDGELRLFGATLESGGRGVEWDGLAINGARASVLGRFDRAHWISELRHRDPRLVVLHFGANEGANRFLVIEEYRDDLADVIGTIREALPRASILVVGPMDQARRLDAGGYGSWPMPEKLNAAQREVALANGCAFFDTFRAMGGRNSMGSWLVQGLGGADMIHPTEHGAKKIGTWIAEALLYGYQELAMAKPAAPADAGDEDAGR